MGRAKRPKSREETPKEGVPNEYREELLKCAVLSCRTTGYLH